MALIHEAYERAPKLPSPKANKTSELKGRPAFSQKAASPAVNQDIDLSVAKDTEKIIPPTRFFMPEMLE